MNNPFLIILTGKTASGKDTVMLKLLEKFPDFKKVLTTTSRIPRQKEVDGSDYKFISKSEFLQKAENGDFIEYVQYGGNLYGTEKNLLISDKNLIWRIDPSRAGQIKNLIRDKKLLVIYLTALDSVILQRLRKRGLSRQEIDRRMREDKDFWKKYKNNYDFIIENVPGNLNETLDKISRIINTSL